MRRFFPMMQGYSTILLATQTIGDDHATMDPDPARDRWQEVLVTVCAEPPLERRWYRHQIFHGDLTRKLDVPVRKHKLPFARAGLGKPE